MDRITRRTFGLGLAGLGVTLAGQGGAVGRAYAAQSQMVSSPSASMLSAYAFTFSDIDGGALPLSRFAGQVMLVVNTASRCGYTGQYAGLQALHERYHARGLVVLAVPSNDFGGQEPGTAEEIKGFCTGTYGVTFPLAGKDVVRGPGAHPFYLWAYRTLGPENAPRWNFHKYLIGRDGRLIDAFATPVPPEDPQIVAAIERELTSKPSS
ncbi:MAG: glutathione peroxidase [Pseudomonadota bacterium]